MYIRIPRPDETRCGGDRACPTRAADELRRAGRGRPREKALFLSSFMYTFADVREACVLGRSKIPFALLALEDAAMTTRQILNSISDFGSLSLFDQPMV